MNRAEHLQWCKDRALEYLPNSPQQALMSFMSDIRKFEPVREVTTPVVRGQHRAIDLGDVTTEQRVQEDIFDPAVLTALLPLALLDAGDPHRMRRWIEGWA